MRISRGTPEARSRLCICRASFLMTFVMSGMPHWLPAQHHGSKASILWHSAFFTVQLSHPYLTTEVQEEPRDRSGPQSPRRKALLHPEPLGGPSAEPRPHLMGAEPRTGRQSRCQRTAGPERAAMGRVTTQQFPVGLCVCVHMRACVREVALKSCI